MNETVTNTEILEVSQAAVEKIVALIKMSGKPGLAVRMALRGRLPRGGYQTEFRFQERSEARTEDIVQPASGFDLFFEPQWPKKFVAPRCILMS